MSEWKTYKLGDLPIQFIDGDRGKNYPKGEDFSEVGHCLFLNAGNVTKNGWDFSENVYISEEKDNLLRNGKLERGDIVLTTRGTIGNVVLYSNDIPYKHIRINSGMVIIRNNNTCYNPYLYQYLRSYLFLGQVQQFQSGSAQPQIPISTLKKLTISLPPLAEQKRIADILSAIDDKIELNRRINANLEQQAQALYKSWFVDFEPFGGKMPEDWREGTLGEICTELKEKVHDRDDVKVLSPVATGQLMLSEEFFTKQVYSKSIAKYIVVPQNCFAYNPARVNIGSLGMNEFDFDGCVSPVYVVFRCLNGYEYFFDLFRRTKPFKDEVKLRAIGGVRQTLGYDDFARIQVNIPTCNVVQDFNKIYLTNLDVRWYNQYEILRLAHLRDTLLPKLMSGEIKVPTN